MQLPYGFLCTLIFFLFNHELLFWDEEFLVALGLLGLYGFIFFSGRKVLRFTLFHKAEVVYFYFYFLLEFLSLLGSLAGALLQALVAQWESFYGLQLSLFLVHRWEAYLSQSRGPLGQGFLVASGYGLWACWRLCLWTAEALGPSLREDLALEQEPLEAGEAGEDLALEQEPLEVLAICGAVYLKGLLV